MTAKSLQPTPIISQTEPHAQAWFLYVLRTVDGRLYTGITIDVSRRLKEHAAGRGAKSLRGAGPLELVFESRVGARGRALRMEARVKRLKREDKERLVAGEFSLDDILEA